MKDIMINFKTLLKKMSKSFSSLAKRCILALNNTKNIIMSMHLHYGVKYEQLGYYLDFFQAGKFVGSMVLQEPDRKEVGYYSKKIAVSDFTFKLDNGKKIQAGLEYHTYMYPLCGRSDFDVTKVAPMFNKK